MMDPKMVEELRAIFFQTLADIEANRYIAPGGAVEFRQTSNMHCSAIVATPDKVAKMIDGAASCPKLETPNSVSVIVRNVDSLEGAELAREMACCDDASCKPPLVLIFSHPYEPGGGEMHGSIVQEEDLCRRTTVYASLSSKEAQLFYETNKSSGTYLFSHAMVISPHVEVFRDADYQYLDEPREIATIACAAPFVPELDSISKGELFSTVKARILGMLLFSSENGYRDLVMGGWGCGAFGNSPDLVAKAFCEAIKDMQALSPNNEDGLGECDSMPRNVVFAVLDRSPDKHSLRAFEDAFSEFDTCAQV